MQLWSVQPWGGPPAQCGVARAGTVLEGRSPEARDPRLETALFWNSWMRLRVRFQEAVTDNKQHVMAWHVPGFSRRPHRERKMPARGTLYVRP